MKKSARTSKSRSNARMSVSASAAILAAGLASSGCSISNIANHAKDLDRIDKATYADSAERAEALMTPELRAHCQAQIKQVHKEGTEILGTLKFVPEMAKIARPRVYQNERRVARTAAFVTKCRSDNAFGSKTTNFCGCFYEVPKGRLIFIVAMNEKYFRPPLF